MTGEACQTSARGVGPSVGIVELASPSRVGKALGDRRLFYNTSKMCARSRARSRFESDVSYTDFDEN